MPADTKNLIASQKSIEDPVVYIVPSTGGYTVHKLSPLRVVEGLSDATGTISFESHAQPGAYLRSDPKTAAGQSKLHRMMAVMTLSNMHRGKWCLVFAMKRASTHLNPLPIHGITLHDVMMS